MFDSVESITLRMEVEEDANSMVAPSYICTLMSIVSSRELLACNGSGGSVIVYQGGIIIRNEVNRHHWFE